jgi:hypothetical protein
MGPTYAGAGDDQLRDSSIDTPVQQSNPSVVWSSRWRVRAEAMSREIAS